MDTQNRILKCDTTSLLDLKAELYKKQEACKLAKTHQNFVSRKGLTIKGQEITSKKKDKTVPETAEISGDNYEDEMLQKSRMMLEAKAKMYEKIVEKKVVLDEEFNDSYLVDFQRKEPIQHPANIHKCDHVIDKSDSEKGPICKEEQTLPDSLKLSNQVSASYQSLESESQKSHSSSPNQVEKTGTTVQQNTDGPVHYQNVQFNEIRDHGVGYFSFSQEEKERQEQMELLKNLRKETIESKQTNEKLKQKKQALLQSRLAKVCQRRNIDSSVLQAYTKKEEETEGTSDGARLEQSSSTPADQSKSTNSVPDANESPKKIRPWDMGKSNLDFPMQIPKKKQSGAEKWLEHKRSERNEEFAPPSFYFNSPEEPKRKKNCQDH